MNVWPITINEYLHNLIRLLKKVSTVSAVSGQP